MESKTVMFSVLFLVWLTLVNGSPASLKEGRLTKATNVSWSSYNFKTILSWGPKPVNYTYTVEFSRVGPTGQNKDKQTNPHCIRSTETECDLTNELDIKGVYSADILSESSHRTSDYVEPPFARSKRFCPYNDTLIGRPEFKLKVTENKILLIITDPMTALHKDGRSQNIRDVFKKNLKYKIEYNKAGSTGKKTLTVNESKAEFNSLDKDQSYCFSVAAYIPSRKDKRVGEWSIPKCSSQEYKSLFEEYGLTVIGGAALIILAFLIAVIVLIVVCCKRAHRQTTISKETIV